MAETSPTKPPPTPLMTRAGWELAAPVATAMAATGGYVFGLGGIAAAAGAAGVAAGAGRLRHRQRPGQRRRQATARQVTRRSTAATRSGGGLRMPGLGRAAGTADGGGRKGSGRASGSGSAGRSGGGRGLGIPGLGRRSGSAAAGRSGRPTGSGGGSRGGLGGGLRGLLGGRRSAAGSGRSSGASRTGTGTGRGGAGSRSRGTLPRLRSLLRRGKTAPSGGTAGRKPGATSGPTGTSRTRGPNRGWVRRATGWACRRTTGGTGGGTARHRWGVPAWVARIRRRRGTPTRPPSTPPSRNRVVRSAVDRALGATAAPTTGRRRAATPATTAPATTTGRAAAPTTSPGGAMAPNPFAVVIDACSTASGSFRPDNAKAVLAWYEGMSDLIDAVAGMLRAQGATATEELYMYPAAGEFARALGNQFLRYKDPCAEAYAMFRSMHADDIERITNPQHNQDRWDVSRNRD